ncbi:MAG: DsbA family protein [Rhodobacteraceae bacterium]|nr:DsbA family protein [Paracoccaceae bacterium]
MNVTKLTWFAVPLIALGIGAAPARALDLNAMSDAERDAFQAQVRAYLLEHPEVIMEAVAVLEQRQQAQQGEADKTMISDNKAAIFEDGVSWVGGNPDGDVTLVEFMDYRCGYCRRAFDDVASLVESDGNIRFVVKEFPILGEDSVQAARFAIATREVAGDAAYEKAHNSLMKLQGPVNDAALSRLARDLDLDGPAILAAMDDAAVTEEIRANHALAQKLAINGTPTFVLADEMLRGYVPLADMQRIVEQVRTE